MPLPPSRDAVANDLGESYQVILGTAQGASKTITAATNASPIVITSAAHGYANGTLVTVQGVNGNTAANGVWFIAAVATNTFNLVGSIGNATYTNGGTVISGTGRVGYLFDQSKGVDGFHVSPQKHSEGKETVYIASSDYLTMRDSEFSRIYLNDFRGGVGQITMNVQDPKSKWRLFNSNGCNIDQQGIVTPVIDFVERYNDADNGSPYRRPLISAGGYLYYGASSAVKFSTASNFSATPSSAAISAGGGSVTLDLATDGQYVYAALSGVNGVGAARIDKFAIGSTTQGTNWNSNYATTRIIYANRRIYGAASAVFYEIAIASGTATADYTAPTGWAILDLCAVGGGVVDSSILILATQSTTRGPSAVWLWDGTTIHDYVSLPNGFNPHRIKTYLGVTYISGWEYDQGGSVQLPRVYTIVQGQLSSLGYITGVPQSNGNPAEPVQASTNPDTTGMFDMDFNGTSAYFLVPSTGLAVPTGMTLSGSLINQTEIWKYDIVNGGFSRFFHYVTNQQQGSNILFWSGRLWFSQLGGISGTLYGRLISQTTTFLTAGQFVTSDLNVGQPWISNLWPRIEITHSVIGNAEAHTIEYSTDQGTTWTTATPEYIASTTGGANHYYLIPPTLSAGAVQGPYIRLRVTLTSGTGQTTTIQMYSLAVVAMPMDPVGNVLEAWLACPMELRMPNGGPDKQGLSGQERIQQIINLYETQAIVDCIFMATSTGRAKNPKTIQVVVDFYELTEPANVGLGPDKTIEGTMHVVLRQIV